MKKTKRVAWIVVLVMAFALTTMGGIPCAQAKTVLKIAHNAPINHPYQDGYEVFKKYVEANSDIEVQIFPSSQLGSEEEVTQMVMMGTVAVNIVSTGALAGFVPEVSLFNLPFIFKDLNHFYRVMDGSVGQDMAAKIEKKINVKALGWLFCGVRNEWNSKKPVKTPADLKGLKIRTMGDKVFVDTWNTLGAQAAPISFEELYTSLQQGVVDGAECDNVDLMVMKFYEVTKYVSLTEHMYLATIILMNNSQFNKLSNDEQAVVIKAGEMATKAERKKYAEWMGSIQGELEKKGLQFISVDKAPWISASQSIYEKYADKVGGMDLIKKVQGM